MQIARDSGRITNSYASDKPCPWCKVGKQRYDLEFQVMTIEKGEAVESTQTLKDICAHCLTVCDELPRIDFLCAKCGQLTISNETDGSEWKLFLRTISSDVKFEEFYDRLIEGGIQNGKRYCLHCTDKIWQGYLTNSDFLQKVLAEPKPHIPLKTSTTK